MSKHDVHSSCTSRCTCRLGSDIVASPLPEPRTRTKARRRFCRSFKARQDCNKCMFPFHELRIPQCSSAPSSFPKVSIVGQSVLPPHGLIQSVLYKMSLQIYLDPLAGKMVDISRCIYSGSAYRIPVAILRFFQKLLAGEVVLV